MRRLAFLLLCLAALLPALSLRAQEIGVTIRLLPGVPIRFAYRVALGNQDRFYLVNGDETSEIASGYRFESEGVSAVWSADCTDIFFSGVEPQNRNNGLWSIYRANPDTDDVRPLYPPQNLLPTSPMPSPGGSWIAFNTFPDSANANVVSTDGGEIIPVRGSHFHVEDWLNDDYLLIAFAKRLPDNSVDRRLFVSDLTVNPPETVELLGQHIAAIASPDGAQIALISRDESYQLDLYTSDGTFLHSLAADSSSYYPAWSRDSQHIAYLNVNSELIVVNVADPMNTRTLPLPDFPRVTTFSTIRGWLPGDQEVLVAVDMLDNFYNRSLFLIDVTTGASRLVLEAPSTDQGLYSWIPCILSQDN